MIGEQSGLATGRVGVECSKNSPDLKLEKKTRSAPETPNGWKIAPGFESGEDPKSDGTTRAVHYGGAMAGMGKSRCAAATAEASGGGAARTAEVGGSGGGTVSCDRRGRDMGAFASAKEGAAAAR